MFVSHFCRGNFASRSTPTGDVGTLLSFQSVNHETKVSLCQLSLQANPSGFTCTSKTVVQKELIPEMANPLKPTARTRKEMATARVWEKPTTSSRVASIPNPVINMCKSILKVTAFLIA